MRREVSGTFHGIDGVKVGDVVEVDDVNGARYCKLGYAEPVGDHKPKVEKPEVPTGELRAVDVDGDVSVTTEAAVDKNVGAPVLTAESGKPVTGDHPYQSPEKPGPRKAPAKAADK
jgi:hypothetical protein